MILKGNQRGGGQQLAAHLMNAFDNDSVEIVDVRGAVAQDLSGAFAEWGAQGRATKIEKKYYYSLSLSPDPAQGHLTDEQYFDLIGRVERSLNLVGQPRAVVFHEKRDDKGVLRHHCHAVWSRVDTSGPKIKAVDISHDRLKLQSVARQFCRDHRLQLPHAKARKSRDGNRDSFNQSAREDLGERQQKERTGISKEERAAIIAGCWTATSNGAAFVKAMEDKNYYLARGDSRDYVVIDLHGEVHSLSRQLTGAAKSKDLRERLSGFPPAKQRNVEETQSLVAEKRKEAIRRAVAPKEARPSEVELRRQALEERQKQRRDALGLMRANLLERHAMERGKLEEAQRAQTQGVMAARAQNQPRGVMGFLARVTGIQLVIDVRHKHQDKVRTADHARQTVALRRTHDRELRDMDRRDRELGRLETRENRSAETALRREEFQMVLRGKPPQRAVSADFEKAAALPRAVSATGGKGLSTTFGEHAAAAMRKGELRAAFERAVSAKSAAGDNAAGGRAPADPDSASEAARTRDQLRARRPRPGPDPDRDRER
jgi:hypothetical protein